ncbi:hypothetical protein PFISCL1PPCAC_13253, partial [Pristionchus fissidentatus]
MKALPVAHHTIIQDNSIIDRGFHCQFQSSETINGNTKQVGFYPAQFMRSCKDEECTRNGKVHTFPFSTRSHKLQTTRVSLSFSKDHNHADLIPFPLNSNGMSV